MDKDARQAYKTLRKYKEYMTRQQLKTLAGQIKSGSVDAAMKGLTKIVARALATEAT